MEKLFVAIAGLLLSGVAHAYLDAENFNQAVGYLKSHMIAADITLRECSARYPDLTEQMRQDLEKWKDLESAALAKVERYWAKAEAADPGVTDKLVAMNEIGARTMFATLSAAETVARKKDVAQRSACVAHFSALGSGAWRTRAPKAYKFIDDAPGP